MNWNQLRIKEEVELECSQGPQGEEDYCSVFITKIPAYTLCRVSNKIGAGITPTALAEYFMEESKTFIFHDAELTKPVVFSKSPHITLDDMANFTEVIARQNSSFIDKVFSQGKKIKAWVMKRLKESAPGLAERIEEILDKPRMEMEKTQSLKRTIPEPPGA
jgi:hypothetical protein